MAKRLILTGIFRNDDAAKAAINSLEKKGKSRDDIAALFADRSDGLAFRIREKTKASEGGAAGSLLGTLVGGVIAALISFSDATPTGATTLGFIDPLIAVFSGIGMGSVVGATIGAIIGRGIPEHEARVTRGNLKSGNILLAVAADPEERDELLHILRSTGGKHLTAADKKFENEVGHREVEEDEDDKNQPALPPA